MKWTVFNRLKAKADLHRTHVWSEEKRAGGGDEFLAVSSNVPLAQIAVWIRDTFPLNLTFSLGEKEQPLIDFVICVSCGAEFRRALAGTPGVSPTFHELSRTGPRLGLRWQAERDTAFARTRGIRDSMAVRPLESAVAAALPAQSKMGRKGRFVEMRAAFFQFKSLSPLGRERILPTKVRALNP